MNIISLSKKRGQTTPVDEQRKLDAKASCVILEECLKQLELNNMPELKECKTSIKNKIKELKEIAKNG